MNEETRKPGRMRRVISTLLIIAGLILIFVPIVGKYLVNREQEAMMAEFYLELEQQSVEAETTEATSELDIALDWGSQVENQEEISDATEAIVSEVIHEEQLQETETIQAMAKALGVIYIDKINCKLPISEGVDLGTLRYAIGHMPGTAGLGEIGNSVLAGHRSHTFNAFFNRLDEVIVGDTIVIEDEDGEKTTYEVYEKLFVKPDNLSVLNSTDDYRVLTLITCHPEINPTGRIIIHAVDKNQLLK